MVSNEDARAQIALGQALHDEVGPLTGIELVHFYMFVTTKVANDLPIDLAVFREAVSFARRASRGAATPR